MSQKLSILIPAYNEEKTITLILERVMAVQLPDNLEKEVIVVNDASTDATERVVTEFMKKLTVGSGQWAVG
ncbi:MAG: glycosyltransferase, partial [Bacteroidales bacterium]|nr:glycosyltransferase [Bacteroidales bacterium]